MNNVNVLLIVPCYNEENRLKLDEFKKYSSSISFLFANDGSQDRTEQLIKPVVNNEEIYLYTTNINKGKAQVVFDAYNYAKSEKILEKYDWVGYWDADLATPLWEVENMLKLAISQQADSVWGSRVSRLGSNIQRSKIRHYLGRAFATIASFILKVSSYDSQCGAKIFSLECSQKAFDSRFITNWVFDIEILIKIQHKKIIEYPLLEWTDVPGSKVNFTKDLPRVLGDLFKLWKKYIN